MAKPNLAPRSTAPRFKTGKAPGSANVAGVDVRLVAEVAGGTGKNLGTGRELNVRLKTDHNFPLHGLFLLRLSITGRTAKMPVRFTLPGSRDPEQTGFAERFAE